MREAPKAKISTAFLLAGNKQEKEKGTQEKRSQDFLSPTRLHLVEDVDILPWA